MCEILPNLPACPQVICNITLPLAGLTIVDQRGREFYVICPTADERDCWVKNLERVSASGGEEEHEALQSGAGKEAPITCLTAEEIEEMERVSRENEMDDFQVLASREGAGRPGLLNKQLQGMHLYL